MRIWDATSGSKYGSWTIVWVEWKNVGDYRNLFYINGAEVQGTPPIEKSGISIGGRFDGSGALNGSISALVIYVGSKRIFPDVIRNLMISSQMIKSDVTEEPHVKKKNRPIKLKRIITRLLCIYIPKSAQYHFFCIEISEQQRFTRFYRRSRCKRERHFTEYEGL